MIFFLIILSEKHKMFLNQRIFKDQVWTHKVISSLQFLSHCPPTFFIHFLLPPSVSLLAPKESCFKPSVSVQHTPPLVTREKEKDMWGHNRTITGANSLHSDFSSFLHPSRCQSSTSNYQYIAVLRNKSNQQMTTEQMQSFVVHRDIEKYSADMKSKH